MPEALVSIHDPLHGTIELTATEMKVVDSAAFQRLRFIKQLGFAELAFPGASHSRYLHSLGALHMATRMIDRLLPQLQLAADQAASLRQAVRLAALLHDVGHAPFSHVTEQVMPPVVDLGLAPYLAPGTAAGRQATHEDYTVKLLVDSSLTQILEQEFAGQGVTPALLVALITRHATPACLPILAQAGQTLLPLLSQVISGELDADRMDYLRRDAYYCGVSYGQFDHLWLTRHLAPVEHEGSLTLALQHRAVFAFENFLLARYHMFLSVYYHHTPICFDHMLGQFFATGDYRLPADSEAYLQTDDMQLLLALRASRDSWAQRIVRRRPFKMLLETHGLGDADETAQIEAALAEEKLDTFCVRSRGILSKYFGGEATSSPLLVLEPDLQRSRRIEHYSPLYRRFEEVVDITRFYCLPEQLERGRRCLRGLTTRNPPRGGCLPVSGSGPVP